MEEGSTTSMVTVAIANLNSSPPRFLSKTYDMVDDSSTDAIVSWSRNSNSFVVWNVPVFSSDLLPSYFKHNNFSSFVRQLNTYGFRKVDPDRWEFANECFLRGQKHLLKSINRRKPAHGPAPVQQQHSEQTISSCVELRKSGLDEEVDRFKRDKNVLMQEIVRLRQQHLATDNQLQIVGQHIQVMEQRQQQMMSFLAKAMQTPGFLSQMVHQQKESSRQITGITKKRRLQTHGEVNAGVMDAAALDGQVKCHPVMSEAAKSKLRQIFKLNTPARLDQSMSEPHAFLIHNVPSPSSALDNRSSLGQTTGLSLFNVPPTSRSHSSLTEAVLPASTIPAASCNVDSSPFTVNDPTKSTQFPGANINSSSLEGRILSGLNETQPVLPQSAFGVPDMTSAGTRIDNPGHADPVLATGHATMSLETNGVLSASDLGGILDYTPKLPGNNDAFWEQCFSASTFLFDEDMEEVDSSTPEQDLQCDLDEGQNMFVHVDHLTEQMRFLVAESKKE